MKVYTISTIKSRITTISLTGIPKSPLPNGERAACLRQAGGEGEESFSRIKI